MHVPAFTGIHHAHSTPSSSLRQCRAEFQLDDGEPRLHRSGSCLQHLPHSRRAVDAPIDFVGADAKDRAAALGFNTALLSTSLSTPFFGCHRLAVNVSCAEGLRCCNCGLDRHVWCAGVSLVRAARFAVVDRRPKAHTAACWRS